MIAYPNNAKFNSYRGNPSGEPTPSPAGEPARAGGSVNRRGMFLAHRVDDFTLANLTLWNTTPQGGSQAEALIVNGSASARAVIKDVNFRSFQDTIQLNGQVYVTGCFIEGDVDFMWGTGPAFFEHCTARSLRSSAYYTQVRNPAGQHGFVFVRCTFEGAPGVTENFLSRIEPHRFPHSEVVLIDCTLGASVAAVGWQLQALRRRAAGIDLESPVHGIQQPRPRRYTCRREPAPVCLPPTAASGRRGARRELFRPDLRAGSRLAAASSPNHGAMTSALLVTAAARAAFCGHAVRVASGITLEASPS